MAINLTFFGWWHPKGAAVISGPTLSNGRLTGKLELTATDIERSADTAKRTVQFEFFGPGDVTGLAPSAVTHTFPSAGARNVEYDKSVYAELAAPDLPWRYTLQRPQGKSLRPWIVLLVGTANEISVTGSTAVLQASVLDAHPTAKASRGAHVEQDASHPDFPSVSRLISTRALEPDRDYVAVIVPGYAADGQLAWTTPAAGPMELTAYYHWNFRTRTGGDFAMLTRRLKLRGADSNLGSADLSYGPLPSTSTLSLQGALIPVTNSSSAALPVSAEISADLAALTSNAGIGGRRPVLGLPSHDALWPPVAGGEKGPEWRTMLRTDPRVRAIVGLGTQAAIHHQDFLAREAGLLAGAYEDAAERLRRLSFGLLLSQSLWRRRVPTDAARRLAVLGPGLRNVLTKKGPLTDQMQHPDRALDASLFSSAAKRAWRGGTPRVSNTTTDGHGSAIRQAAIAPALQPRSRTSVLHTDEFAKMNRRVPLDETIAKPVPSLTKLGTVTTALAKAIDRSNLDVDTVNVLDVRLKAVIDRLGAGKPTAILPLLRLVDSSLASRPSREQLRALAAALDAEPDADDLAALGARVARRPRERTRLPFDLDRTARAVDQAFDPTLINSSIVNRVTAGIRGIDGDPRAPQETTPELKFPAWRFLRDESPEWLLPGGGDLPDDSVVALSTNPAFVDEFLLGLNFQVLTELRFRNLPIISGWTPMRTFWDRANPGTSAVDDDILEIASWPDKSAFGSRLHQAPSAASADFVVLFNTSLFREYPGTLVYLVPAPRRSRADSGPDWAAEPIFSAALFPSFQGQLASERVFFGFDIDPALVLQRWVVLEETVKGRRFWNAAAGPAVANKIATTTNGADLASATVTEPRRVLIRGDVLIGGTAP